MRKLILSADQFDTFVFQQVTTVPAENENEFETSLRLLRKLKDPAITKEAPLTDAEHRAVEEGNRVFPYRKASTQVEAAAKSMSKHVACARCTSVRKPSTFLPSNSSLTPARRGRCVRLCSMLGSTMSTENDRCGKYST